MPATHRNRLVTAISNTPGASGALTIAAAASGYRTFGAGDNGLSFDVSIVDGTSWEIRTGCVYTHSGTSLARGTLEDSSTGSAITLTSSAVVTVTMTAGFGNRLNSAAMTQITGTDANTSMSVGNVYAVDMSSWATADRTYTLPAVAALGDMVSVMVAAGSATHELIITASSGDTLNGVAGGTEWSRVFITGEVLIFRCISASAGWVAEHDGRIPQAASITRPTADTIGSGAWEKVLCNTVDGDNASIVDTTNSRITPRRSGKYLVSGFCSVGSIPNAKRVVCGAYKDGAMKINGATFWNAATVTTQTATFSGIDSAFVAGSYFELYTYQDAGSSQSTGTGDNMPRIGLSEII